MKEASPWNNAHVRLKRLYEARVPLIVDEDTKERRPMKQKEFGEKYDIGSQSMVAQYVNGTRPLNYDAAAKFAKGLRCTIYDISPEMAESLQFEILPYLGKAMRRAAMYAALAVLPALTPTTADATTQVPDFARIVEQLCIMLNRARSAFTHTISRIVGLSKYSFA